MFECWTLKNVSPNVIHPLFARYFYDGQIEGKFTALFTRCLCVGEQRALFETFFHRCTPIFQPLVNNAGFEGIEEIALVMDEGLHRFFKLMFFSKI